MDLFKKYSKYIILGVIALVVILGSFIISKTFAKEEIEIVQIYSNSSNYFGILYSNNTLEFRIKGQKFIRKNIKKCVISSDDVFYLDLNNNLHMISDEMIDDNIVENITDFLVLENVKEIKQKKYSRDLNVLTNDNKLYFISDYNQDSTSEKSFYGYYLRFIADNVKSIAEHTLFLDNDNNLWAFGNNHYGQKINDGEFLNEPIKLLSDIIDYNEYHALDKKGNLYVFSPGLAIPTIIKDNISSFGDYYSNYEDYYYGYDYKIGNISVKDNNGNDYLLQYSVDDNLEILAYDSIKNNIVYEQKEYFYWGKTFLMNGVIYYYDNNKFYVISENVEKYDEGCILKKDNTLYIIPDKNIEISSESVRYRLYHQTMLKGGKHYKILDNVKNIYKTEDNREWYVMNNNIIFDSQYYQIEHLYSNIDVITIYDIQLVTRDKIEFSIGEEFDYYVNIFPYNYSNKEVIWKSSNPDVMTISDNGKLTAISEGKAIISVETTDGEIKEEVEIVVHPNINGIEILGSDVLEVKTNEELILEANVIPNDTLDTEVVWTASSSNVELRDWATSPEHDGYYYYLPNNKRNIYITKPGTYTITVTSKNGLYSDTVNITAVQKIYRINIDIDDNYFDGIGNAFIYLNENKNLQVNYSIYPETATNRNVIWKSSDESVATISDNGLITAKKVGRTTITVSSEDGNYSTHFNVLVYDYQASGQVIGDVNNDGKVNIMDVIKLRRYLAGLEDLE